MSTTYALSSPPIASTFYHVPCNQLTHDIPFGNFAQSEYTTYAHTQAMMMLPSNPPAYPFVAPFNPVHMAPPHLQKPFPLNSMPPPTQCTPRTNPSSTPLPPPLTVRTEARKIVIKGLPLSTTQSELQELLARVSSTTSSSPGSQHQHSYGDAQHQLSKLDIAKRPDGRPKGLAFAVFASHDAARRAVKYLNSHTWHNKQLSAHLAKEGIVEHSPRGTGQDQHSADSSREYRPRHVSGHGNTTPRTERGQVPNARHREELACGSHTGTWVDGAVYLQFSSLDVGISYADVSSSSSSPSTVVSLSSEGEQERGRRMCGYDVRATTPLVVDGSSPGKRSR